MVKASLFVALFALLAPPAFTLTFAGMKFNGDSFVQIGTGENGMFEESFTVSFLVVPALGGGGQQVLLDNYAHLGGQPAAGVRCFLRSLEVPGWALTCSIVDGIGDQVSVSSSSSMPMLPGVAHSVTWSVDIQGGIEARLCVGSSLTDHASSYYEPVRSTQVLRLGRGNRGGPGASREEMFTGILSSFTSYPGAAATCTASHSRGAKERPVDRGGAVK